MTRMTESIYKKALKLPLESRADLVELLLQSIVEDDGSEREKVDAAWAKEARSRFNAYLRGDIKASSMEKVLKFLRKRHTA